MNTDLQTLAEQTFLTRKVNFSGSSGNFVPEWEADWIAGPWQAEGGICAARAQ
jgi:hypothetical protein